MRSFAASEMFYVCFFRRYIVLEDFVFSMIGQKRMIYVTESLEAHCMQVGGVVGHYRHLVWSMCFN